MSGGRLEEGRETAAVAVVDGQQPELVERFGDAGGGGQQPRPREVAAVVPDLALQLDAGEGGPVGQDPMGQVGGPAAQLDARSVGGDGTPSIARRLVVASEVKESE